MTRFTLEEARALYKIWHDAEIALSTGVSYSIAGRSVTRVGMEEIQMMKRKYGRLVDSLENPTRRRSRTSGFHPFDR